MNEEKTRFYKIPVEWTMRGFIYVEAKDLAEACEIAKNDQNIDLPAYSNYLENSWIVDEERAQWYNEDED